jgi:phosphoribosylformylglycinamidine (FGAM) synthase-like enzyme
VKLEADAAPEHALFNERGARAIVSGKPALLARILETARQYNVAAEQIGQVTRDNVLRIEYKGHAAIDSPVASLRDAWDTSLERAVKV